MYVRWKNLPFLFPSQRFVAAAAACASVRTKKHKNNVSFATIEATAGVYETFNRDFFISHISYILITLRVSILLCDLENKALLANFFGAK